MKTILIFAIFVALLAIPQFTNNTTLAHGLRTTIQGYDDREDACYVAKGAVEHSHQGSPEHKSSRCDCEKSGGGWSCTATYG